MVVKVNHNCKVCLPYNIIFLVFPVLTQEKLAPLPGTIFLQVNKIWAFGSGELKYSQWQGLNQN